MRNLNNGWPWGLYVNHDLESGKIKLEYDIASLFSGIIEGKSKEQNACIIGANSSKMHLQID